MSYTRDLEKALKAAFGEIDNLRKYKDLFEEWINKTRFVQEIDDPEIVAGMHRADVCKMMIEKLQELVDWYKQKNIEWQDKYDTEKEQLEQERDYLDDRCAALENDLVLYDMVSKLEKVQTRLADFENLALDFVEYKAPDHICRMHFEMMLKESEEE